MADISYHDPDWHSVRRLSDFAPAPTMGEAEVAASSTAYDCSLRGACGLNARPNAGARAGLLHDMQRTHGNRAVQRQIATQVEPVQRIVQGQDCTPTSDPGGSIEAQIMEALRRIQEARNGSSGPSGGGAVSEGGPLSWLTGAASKAVDWVGKGASKVSEAAGEVVSNPFNMHIDIPDITPETPPLEPWTPWNPYMQPPEMEPSLSPFTPWNPYMDPGLFERPSGGGDGNSIAKAKTDDLNMNYLTGDPVGGAGRTVAGALDSVGGLIDGALGAFGAGGESVGRHEGAFVGPVIDTARRARRLTGPLGGLNRTIDEIFGGGIPGGGYERMPKDDDIWGGDMWGGIGGWSKGGNIVDGAFY